MSIVGAGVQNSDYNEDMLELRSNNFRCERLGSRFLKNNSDYIISYMSFT